MFKVVTQWLDFFYFCRCELWKRNHICVQQAWGSGPPAVYQNRFSRLLPRLLDLLQGWQCAVHLWGERGTGEPRLRQIQPIVHHIQLLSPPRWPEDGGRRLLQLPQSGICRHWCLPVTAHHYFTFQTHWPAARGKPHPELRPLHLLRCRELQVVLHGVRPQLDGWRWDYTSHRQQVVSLSCVVGKWICLFSKTQYNLNYI